MPPHRVFSFDVVTGMHLISVVSYPPSQYSAENFEIQKGESFVHNLKKIEERPKE